MILGFIRLLLIGTILFTTQLSAKSILYHNANFITVDNDFSVETAMIVKDHNITFIGTLQQAKLQQYDQEVDLQGKTVMPAFYDAHSHFSFEELLNPNISEVIDLTTSTLGDGNVNSISDVKDKITAYIADYKQQHDGKLPPLIIGFGYESSEYKEGRDLQSEDLDSVNQGVPTLIIHHSLHQLVLDSSSFDAIYQTLSKKQKNGFMFSKDQQNNLLGGVQEEESLLYFMNKFFDRYQLKLDHKSRIANMRDLYFSYGITTFVDGAHVPQHSLDIFKVPNVDINILELYDEKIQHFSDTNVVEYSKGNNSYIRQVGYKLVLDGSLQISTAAVIDPYIVNADNSTHLNGILNISQQSLENILMDICSIDDVALHIHVNGDLAMQTVLDAVKDIDNKDDDSFDCSNNRIVIIHAQLVNDDQITELAKLNDQGYDISVSLLMSHVFYMQDADARNIGEQRLQKLDRFASFLDADTLVSIHNDSPVFKNDMIKLLATAVTRKGYDGKVLKQDESVSIQDAIKAVTINAAYQMYDEERKGSLEVGKEADFIVLDQNPLTIDVDEIKNLKVLKTYKAGELVFELDQNTK